MDILVFQGGKSLESEVSRRSAKHAISYLEKRHNVKLIDINDKNEFFYNGKQLLVALPYGFFLDGEILECDCAIPFTHGAFGEDGRLQAIFDYMNIPYVSCGVTASAIGINKYLQANLFNSAKLPIIPSFMIPTSIDKMSDKEIEDIIKNLGKNIIVKINRGGSSVGVIKIFDLTKEKLLNAIKDLNKLDKEVIIQPLLENIREFECAVWTQGGDALATDPCEIKTNEEFFDYDTKYNGKDKSYYVDVAPNISDEMKTFIKNIARLAFLRIGGEIYSRVDFILYNDNIFINEINTLPGFTPTSHYPRMIENIMKIEDHFDILISEAIKRWEKNN